MQEIRLDGRLMVSREAAHAQIKQQLDLPEYYGNNLDALHDCLTDIATATHIVVSYAETIKEALGSYGEILLRVLSDVAEENECITVAIDEAE